MTSAACQGLAIGPDVIFVPFVPVPVFPDDAERANSSYRGYADLYNLSRELFTAR
jgi:hypothetical protein